VARAGGLEPPFATPFTTRRVVAGVGYVRVGAWGWFRANLSAVSARRCHQISCPGVSDIRRRAARCRSRRTNWCGRRESNPDLKSGALVLCLRAAPAWWGMGRVERLAAEGRRLQRRDGTARPYWHSPESMFTRLVAGRGVEPRAERLMRPPGPPGLPATDMAEGAGVEPATLRLARCSKPVAPHGALPSCFACAKLAVAG
jgi:hypothetical protein